MLPHPVAVPHQPMPQISQPAYVLHARAYRETSLLLEVFSRDQGRVGVVARGVRGPRGQGRRALLQPLQPLLMACEGRGELQSLRSVEVAGAPVSLRGEALLSAFYVNELLVRLLPRGDPQTDLFWRYATCLAELAEPGAVLAWQLRRFERDLLELLGYGLDLDGGRIGGGVLEAHARYLFDLDAGPVRVDAPLRQPGRLAEVSGAALLALGEDRMPDATGMHELRRLMRAVLLHHLGGRPLQAWQVLAGLGRESADR